ncbi:uncharacterized protein MELLADRAFT_79070 [Melampsora larici-populina 98AG31]|uniref:Response regulatory domain-containing protein n=1 Tax=Melampsora larici-populina (strain 98AG31 / pathotype 3-4-7) TaxID=747676 RepID=F4S2B6_MELLP|nr:uncharacterized protein MELLADRAFT_79070 [Melampsora larici-populina 98AG31]EGG01232.1 hypothetical protein MELLADRAFT_79070 [Melampsora larici-populina 98AG31]
MSSPFSLHPDRYGKQPENSINPTTTPSLKLRILVVDDNDLNLRVMRQILSKKTPDLVHLPSLRVASSGLQALALLSQHVFDLILLDISMPGISGIELCRRIRDLDPNQKSLVLNHNRTIDICAVTTDLQDWQIEIYKKVGMNGVIGKPLKEQDIRYALQLSCDSTLAASQSHRTSTTCKARPTFATISLGSNQSGHANYPFYFRRDGVNENLAFESIITSSSFRTDSSDTISSSFTIVPSGPSTHSTNNATSRPQLNRFDSNCTCSTSSVGCDEPASIGSIDEEIMVSTNSSEQALQSLTPDWYTESAPNVMKVSESDPFDEKFGHAITLRHRKSIPIFPSSQRLPVDVEVNRLSKSATGPHKDDYRPTYQLVWLGTQSQSVLRDGELLDELLGHMGLEDEVEVGAG